VFYEPKTGKAKNKHLTKDAEKGNRGSIGGLRKRKKLASSSEDLGKENASSQLESSISITERRETELVSLRDSSRGGGGKSQS